MTGASLAAPKPTAPRKSIISVGTKLAGATVALMLVVTVAVYFTLSRYQRESLLQAKERAATAVTRLFADTCAAPVVFSDDTAIKDALTTLGRNEEVDYASVWAVDKGKIGDRLSELARGAPAAPRDVPRAITIERLPERVILSSPVRNTASQVVALATVAFSLAPENAAIAEVEGRTLLVSAAVAMGLTMLLVVIARVAIVRPLGQLVFAAKKLEEGTVSELDVHSNDEIGQLAAAFRSMTRAIRSREDRIQARNDDMRLVLDNVGQGFITLELDGRMSDERSRVVSEWFGVPAKGTTFWEYLDHVDPKVAQWFELGWASVREDIMPLEVCLDQLPRSVRCNAGIFELTYRPIINGGQLDKAVVVITDVTARIDRERAEQTQREIMSLFHRILADRTGFEGFFTEAATLVDAIEGSSASDLALLKRQIHTLKGNCALFGLESVASFCHELENRLNESSELFGEKEKEALRALWRRVDDLRGQFVQGGVGRIELDVEEYDAFLDDLRKRVDHQLLLTTVSSWRFESAARRLGSFSEQIQHLAARLGKAEIDVRQEPTKLRLPQRKWGPVWSALSHVIRNAVDHGIETTEERLDAGKPERAKIELGLAIVSPHVVVSIHDDGRGIDWAKIAEKAKDRGLKHATRNDLEEALFAEGISSRSEATASSGRGVGLDAVREMIRLLDGKIAVETEPAMGTTFRFVLPKSMLDDELSRA